MPHKPLSGAFEKVARARAHIEALKRELDSISELPEPERPHTFVPKTDMQCLQGLEIPRQQALREHPYNWPDYTPIDSRNVVTPILESELMGIYLKVRRPLPVIRWGVIIGDAVHDLRSALDQLVWELSVHHQRSLGFPKGAPEKTLRSGSPWRHCDFPVCAKDTSWPGHASNELGLIDKNLTSLIDDEQPYKRGKRYQRHWLWLLNELWNRDKHRAVAVTAMYGHLRRIGLGPSSSASVTLDEFTSRYELQQLWAHNQGRLVDGMKLAAVLIRARNPGLPHENFNLRVETTIRVDIAFEEAAPTYGQWAIPRLTELTTEVERVLNLFVGHLS